MAKNQSNNHQDNFQDDAQEQQLNYTQMAFFALYFGRNYIAINNELYKFDKTHYKLCNMDLEMQRISRWCEDFSPKLAEKSKVKNVLDWVLTKLPVRPEKVNPSGVNLKNGVLKVVWGKDRKGKVKLVKHDPNVIYTYCSDINYDPKADPTDCLKLLECLDPPERKIFLRAIASSFDLPYLRTVLGRNRALMLEGKGSNGKDTLGATVREIFGFAMTNCSLGDFVQYDQGRKFPLAKLENALISWSSENTALGSLDSVQSLKAAITGDLLDCEQKNKDEHSFTPKCLFVFNCNEPPKIKTGLEAIKSRWAILRFTKTYKMNPNKKFGELQADPRFKDDPSFIREKIAPAFLNLLIAELEDLAINGIDYSPVQESFEQLKRESSHLFQFCDDMGIKEDPEGKIYINDLWELLRNWYIDQGVLEIEKSEKGKEKLNWHDQPNKYDRNVKASNQVFQRFSEIFPNITRVKETRDTQKMGYFYLSGIGQIASVASDSHYERDTASGTASGTDATSDAVSLTNQQPDATDAIKPISFKNLKQDEKLKLFSQIALELGLSPDQIEIISKPTKFKIGDKVYSKVDDYGLGTVTHISKLPLYYTVIFDKVTGSYSYNENQLTIESLPEPKFKIGDLVRPLDPSHRSWCGEKGIVNKVIADEYGVLRIKVKFDFKEHEFLENELEHYQETQSNLEIKDVTVMVKVLMSELEMTKKELNELIKFLFNKTTLVKLTDSEIKELIEKLKTMPKKSERSDFAKNKVLNSENNDQ